MTTDSFKQLEEIQFGTALERKRLSKRLESVCGQDVRNRQKLIENVFQSPRVHMHHATHEKRRR